MKETLKNVWWKVPLYSAAAGFVSYWIMVGIVGRFVYVKLPDGTVSSNDTLWMICSAVVFVVVLLIGGLLLFRKMTRKEVFYSATAMVLLNLAMTILSSFLQHSGISLLIVYTREWYAFIVDLLLKTGLNGWISTAISWAAVYLFVLFGKKEEANREP